MPRGIPNKPKSDPSAEINQAQTVVTHISILDPVEQIKASGIPLKSIVVHRAVNSGSSGTPETGFTTQGSNKSRRANLWYTPNGVLMEQSDINKGTLVYKLIPLANISDTFLL